MALAQRGGKDHTDWEGEREGLLSCLIELGKSPMEGKINLLKRTRHVTLKVLLLQWENLPGRSLKIEATRSKHRQASKERSAK